MQAPVRMIMTPAQGCEVGGASVVVVVDPVVVVGLIVVVVVDPVVVVGLIVVVVVDPVVVVGFIVVVVVDPVVVVAFVVVDAPVVVVAPVVVGSVETLPDVDDTHSRRPGAKRQTIALRRVRSATSSRKQSSVLGAALTASAPTGRGSSRSVRTVATGRARVPSCRLSSLIGDWRRELHGGLASGSAPSSTSTSGSGAAAARTCLDRGAAGQSGSACTSNGADPPRA